MEIDLSGFAESTVDLLLQVDLVLDEGQAAPGATGAALLWGSPALYHRRPVEGWRPPSAGERPPNVILIGADTLRADHVGAFRDQALSPSLTPALDRLARESDVWLRAYSTFNSTNPSFASILSGLYGKNHGVYDFGTALSPEHVTLAERFSEAGYDTLAVISASHLGDHNSGLGQGFDSMVLSEHTFAGELPVDTAIEWISGREEPFFAWLHLFDPHTPHTPPGAFGAGLRPLRPTGLHPVGAWTPFRRVGDRGFDEPVLGGERDLYAGEVAYLDRQGDRLLGFLASRDLLEDTIIAFVADHGENLGEHGIDYRHTGLFETTTRVPLMIRWPGRAGPGAAERPETPSERGRRFEGLVQTLDLFPTLLAGAGLETPEGDGTDLRQLTYDGRPGRPAVFAEHADARGVMVRTATHRYMRSTGVPGVTDGAHLWNLEADPEERRDLAGRGLPVEAELSALLDRWLKARRKAPAAESRELSEEERKKLEALGYL
jgi:arylsulfatase A-like enzyme